MGLLKKILKKYPNELKPHVSDLCKMIGVVLKDQFPELKSQTSSFISELSKVLNKEIGSHAKSIIDSLCLNMAHQHNKIRKISTISLIDLLLCDEAANFIDDCYPSFVLISNDKNKETRKTFLLKISDLLQKINSIYLKKYEAKLFLLLLSGISDEDIDNQNLAKKLIEDVGNNIYKLNQEMEKEEGNDKKEESK